MTRSTMYCNGVEQGTLATSGSRADPTKEAMGEVLGFRRRLFLLAQVLSAVLFVGAYSREAYPAWQSMDIRFKRINGETS
jgi:hypothetical protein